MAKVRYTKSQQSELVEFFKFSKSGDKILNTVIFDIIDKYNGDIKLRPYLVSNDVISNFEIPCNFKLLPDGAHKGSPRYKGRRGDMVEAYIWFLHINYGVESVERYIIKNLKLIVAKNLV